MSRGKVDVPADTITQLTDADASGAITLQNNSPYSVVIMGTATATPPNAATMAEGITMPSHGAAVTNTTLAELFPGEAFVRLWALSDKSASMTIYQA